MTTTFKWRRLFRQCKQRKLSLSCDATYLYSFSENGSNELFVNNTIYIFYNTKNLLILFAAQSESTTP